MKTVKALRNLIDETGDLNFIREKEYPVSYPAEEITDNTEVIDEQGDRHFLGNWSRYFKKVD